MPHYSKIDPAAWPAMCRWPDWDNIVHVVQRIYRVEKKGASVQTN